MVREYHFFACVGQMDFRMWMACRIGIGVYLFRVPNIHLYLCGMPIDSLKFICLFSEDDIYKFIWNNNDIEMVIWYNKRKMLQIMRDNKC